MLSGAPDAGRHGLRCTSTPCPAIASAAVILIAAALRPACEDGDPAQAGHFHVRRAKAHLGEVRLEGPHGQVALVRRDRVNTVSDRAAGPWGGLWALSSLACPRPLAS